MATIPGGPKVDPFSLAMEWAKNQNAQKLQADQSIDRANLLEQSNNYARENAMLEPSQEYAKARMRGQAGIQNELDAQEAGLGTPGSLSANATKTSREFQRGLAEGGLTNPFGLAAAMSNAQVESGGWNSNATGDSGTAAHIMQWREDRQTALRRYAKANGDNPMSPSPYIQGKFAAQEMQTTEKDGGDIVMNARSLGEAQQGMQRYLRMKDYDKGTQAHGYAARAGGLNNWYKKITGEKGDATALAENDGWVKDDTGEYKIVYTTPQRVQGYNALVPEMRNKFTAAPDLPWQKGVMPYKYYKSRGVTIPNGAGPAIPTGNYPLNAPNTPPPVPITPTTNPNVNIEPDEEAVATTAALPDKTFETEQ